MIPSAEGTSVGGKAFPSYVAFTQDGQLLVGEPARRQAVTNPNGTIKNVKRKMGTAEKVKALDKEYTPQQISAFILQKIKRDAPGNRGTVRSIGRYERRAYISDMPICLLAADAAICRAGAMTVSEIAAAGVPSILIPYPRATGDHQTKNAKALDEKGAAILLPESELTPETLTEKLAPILRDGENGSRMRAALRHFRVPDCESVILREIRSLCPKIDSRS